MRARARVRTRIEIRGKRGTDMTMQCPTATPQASGVAVGHCIVRGREEGMWEEDQREEDSGRRREDDTSARQSSEVCSTFHF